MYLYLTSRDFSGYHPGNTGSDFIVTLPASYYFSRNEEWEIGLVDLYVELPWGVRVKKPEITKLLHVYCDSVEPSIYNGGERKLLTVTRMKDCIQNIYQPVHVRYIPLSQERLSTMHLYLRYCDGEFVSLEGLTSSCTLHIKKKKPTTQ